MGWTVVDKQEKSAPSVERKFEEPDELALSFALVECVRESSLSSCAENIRADILVVDEH